MKPKLRNLICNESRDGEFVAVLCLSLHLLMVSNEINNRVTARFMKYTHFHIPPERW